MLYRYEQTFKFCQNSQYLKLILLNYMTDLALTLYHKFAANNFENISIIKEWLLNMVENIVAKGEIGHYDVSQVICCIWVQMCLQVRFKRFNTVTDTKMSDKMWLHGGSDYNDHGCI